MAAAGWSDARLACQFRRMPRRRRKRCAHCNEQFWPHPRLGRRQIVCRKPECLLWRRRQSKRRWHQQHPEDAAGRRLRAALAKAKQPEVKLELPRPPPRGIPWEELRDEISPQQLVIVSFFVRLVSRSGRDAISAEVSRIAAEFVNYGSTSAKDAIGPRAPPS
jgi:hypothetical protein